MDIFSDSLPRELGGGGGGDFGIHVSYDDIWFVMVYLASIYILGFLGSQFLGMPALVGQIFAGIIFGPEVFDQVPYPEAFVLLGEIGLVLLVVEAGVDIDITTLKLIGVRGVIIAFVGSVLPIVLGIGVAFIIGAEPKAAIAAGAAFGPTSLGIAMNILKTGKIINTPTGQLIIAAAIIDDMIALIILSQLTALTGEITLAGVLQPILVALVFLIIGGYIALFVISDLIEKYIFNEGMSSKKRGVISLIIMWGFVLGLMPATHYPGASHLMGAFLAGLVFCSDHDLHVEFVSQFKRTLQWLMRIFFASTIGFQVPIKNFANGKVIYQGLLFTLALLGKLGVGFLVPNFSNSKKFRGNHLRDCLMVGCSMAAEGEFAFVIAAYSVAEGIIDIELYSSVVLAILLSTIVAPFSLKFTISYFNKRALEDVENAEKEMLSGDMEDQLKNGIIDGSFVFFCINTTSHASWGTLPNLMKTLLENDLGVIDHRSWHSRFEDTVINEMYVKGTAVGDTEISKYIEKIETAIKAGINQEDSVVSVIQWMPSILEEIKDPAKNPSKHGTNINNTLISEAQSCLNLHEDKDKHKDTISALKVGITPPTINETGVPGSDAIIANRKSRRSRTTSTPVGTNNMFQQSREVFQPLDPIRRRMVKTKSTPLSGDMWKDPASVVVSLGEVAVTITGPGGEIFESKMKMATLNNIRKASGPVTLVEAEKGSTFTGEKLDGFVRRKGRTRGNSGLLGFSLPEEKDSEPE